MFLSYNGFVTNYEPNDIPTPILTKHETETENMVHATPANTLTC